MSGGGDNATLTTVTTSPEDTAGELGSDSLIVKDGEVTNSSVSELEPPKLKIVSWNINGMKTLDMPEVLKQLDSPIVAVQETKLTSMRNV